MRTKRKNDVEDQRPIVLFWKCLGLALLITAGMYLSTAVSLFERHDDYFFADHLNSPSTPCRSSWTYSAMVAQGRPLMAELTACVVEPMLRRFESHSVYYFAFLRGINLILIAVAFALCAFLFVRYLRLGLALSFAASALIFSLPAFQFFASQSVAVSNLVSLVLAMAAAVVLASAKPPSRFADIFDQRRKVALSGFLLLAAISDYQTNAMAFLWPCAAILLFPSHLDWNARRWMVIRFLLVFGLALASYWALFKGVFLPLFKLFHPHAQFGGGYGMISPTFLPSQMFTNLATSLKLDRALNVWFLTEQDWRPAQWMGAFLGLSLLLFLIIETFRAFGQGRLKERVLMWGETVLLLGAVIVAVHTPHIFYGPIYYYRVAFIYSAVIVLVLIAAVIYWCGFLRSWTRRSAVILLCTAGVFFGGLSAYHTSHYFIYPAMYEIDYLEGAVQVLLNKEASSVIIIRPRGNMLLGGDEHSMLTSCFDNYYGLQGMMRRIYKRNGLDPARLEFEVPENRRILIVRDREIIKTGNDRQLLVNMDVPLKVLIINK